MNVLNYKLYYFLGIGGIGMSALARFFKHHEKEIKGYDKTSTSLTNELEKEGIPCHFEEKVEDLKSFLENYKKEEVLVVYTPAIPNSNSELIYLKESGYSLLKRSVVLGEITKHYKTIAIAGTHGKTTTTTLLTHLLHCAGLNCFSFMGGISGNFESNLLLGDIKKPNPLFIVEADEYDRSFLTLEPYIALVTSTDADHLDIYGDDSSVKEGYRLFTKKLQSGGILLVKKNVDNDLKLTEHRLIYSLNLNTEYRADSIRVENGHFVYDIKSPIEDIPAVTLGLPGLHNVENSVAAVAIAQQLGVKGGVLKEALRSFKGVKRRFDYRIRTSNCIYIDDYAHHPEELKATIQSVRTLHPDKKITGVFQPHLFSRTKDFVEDFAKSLDLLDECILLEIYPAREKAIAGVTSSWMMEHMKLKNKRVMTKSEVIEEIKKAPPELLLTMGAGDIDQLIEQFETILNTN